MILNYIKQSIFEKWNEYDGHPTYLRSNVSFNHIFPPTEWEEYRLIEEEKGFVFPEELKAFYSQCNGVRLFLSSLSIFGIQNHKDLIEPYDLRIENYNIQARMKENNCDSSKWFFFGSYARDYVFAFQIGTHTQGGYYLLENGKDKVIKTFNTFDELVHYFVPRILDHYNDKYECDIPKEKYKKFPALANALYDITAVDL